MPAINQRQVGIEARRKTAYGRFYDIPVRPDDPFESITNILNILNKPAIGPWMAKEERKMCIALAYRLFTQSISATDEGVFSKLFEAELGKQKAGIKLLLAAAEIGTGTHSLIEYWARVQLGWPVGPRPTVGDKSEWGFMAFEDWAKAHSFIPQLAEMVVYSLTHHYAGTLDLFGLVDGVPTLVDIKTGRAVYAESKLQCSAYVTAMREMGLGNPERAIVLRLPKVETDPEFEAVEITDIDKHFKAFLSAQQLWRWNYEQEQEYRAKTEEVA